MILLGLVRPKMTTGVNFYIHTCCIVILLLALDLHLYFETLG